MQTERHTGRNRQTFCKTGKYKWARGSLFIRKMINHINYALRLNQRGLDCTVWGLKEYSWANYRPSEPGDSSRIFGDRFYDACRH